MQDFEVENLTSPMRELQELFHTESKFLRSIIVFSSVWLRALRGFSELNDDSKSPFSINQVVSLLKCQEAVEIMIDVHRDIFATFGDALLLNIPLPRVCQRLQDAVAKVCSSYTKYCAVYKLAQLELQKGLDPDQVFGDIRMIFHVRLPLSFRPTLNLRSLMLIYIFWNGLRMSSSSR